jgi:hypothetical protein
MRPAHLTTNIHLSAVRSTRCRGGRFCRIVSADPRARSRCRRNGRSDALALRYYGERRAATLRRTHEAPVSCRSGPHCGGKLGETDLRFEMWQRHLVREVFVRVFPAVRCLTTGWRAVTWQQS